MISQKNRSVQNVITASICKSYALDTLKTNSTQQNVLLLAVRDEIIRLVYAVNIIFNEDVEQKTNIFLNTQTLC